MSNYKKIPLLPDPLVKLKAQPTESGTYIALMGDRMVAVAIEFHGDGRYMITANDGQTSSAHCIPSDFDQWFEINHTA